MKKIIVLMAFFALFASSCKKEGILAPKPKAEFSFVLQNNGYVQFTNLSTDATSFSWNMGNNVTRTGDSFSYQYLANNNFQVSLTATGSGGSDVIVKNVSISSIKGNLVIYKKFGTRGDRNINVYVDGSYVGAINGSKYYSSAPDCGNQDSVTAENLSLGSHRIEAKETGSFPYSWNNTTTIYSGCNTYSLGL